MAKPSWKEKAALLVDKHLDVFNALNINDYEFIPKCAYIPKGKTEKYITLFPSEIKKSKDIYTEFVSINVEPEDPKRQLYKWRFNPHYEEEYEKLKNESNDDYRYLIPIKELIAVNIPEAPVAKALREDIPDFMKEFGVNTNGEIKLTDMTAKDLAAIIWKKPISDKSSINKLIRENE